MLKKEESIKIETTIILVLSLRIVERSLTGKKPPDEINVKAKFSELNDLIEQKFNIIKIIKVRPEYNKKILVACLKISELSNEIKFVRVF